MSEPTRPRTRRRHPEGCLRASGSGGGSRTPLCGTSWREPVPRPLDHHVFGPIASHRAQISPARRGRHQGTEANALLAAWFLVTHRQMAMEVRETPGSDPGRVSPGARAGPFPVTDGDRTEGQKSARTHCSQWGRPGRAGGPAMEDQPEAEHAPLRGGNHGVEGRLDLHRVGLRRSGPGGADSRCTWVSTGRPGRSKATLRTTLAVLRPTPGRVTRSAMAEGTSPPKRSTTTPGHADEVAGLGPEEPRRVDDLLHLRRVGGGQRVGVGVPGEERWRGQVHPLVRALGRQDGGSQQLERIGVVQGAQLVGGAREDLGQAFGRPPGPPGRSAGSGHDRQTTGSVLSMDGPRARRRARTRPPPSGMPSMSWPRGFRPT